LLTWGTAAVTPSVLRAGKRTHGETQPGCALAAGGTSVWWRLVAYDEKQSCGGSTQLSKLSSDNSKFWYMTCQIFKNLRPKLEEKKVSF
jgi:hypothetical protein